MKIHQSNYKIVGFTETTEVRHLSTLDVPLVADIGSGLLDESCPWLDDGPPDWIKGEPAAKQTLEHGANVITFSGDKLLGGPQAGIIAGDADLISKCMKHPLARAIRPGSLTLFSLEKLALNYLNRDWKEIPFWKMAMASIDNLEERAEKIGVGVVSAMDSIPGGGTLPNVRIPSIGLMVEGDRSDALRSGLYGGPPIIARVEDGKTFLDLRTVDPIFDVSLTNALRDLN